MTDLELFWFLFCISIGIVLGRLIVYLVFKRPRKRNKHRSGYRPNKGEASETNQGVPPRKP